MTAKSSRCVVHAAMIEGASMQTHLPHEGGRTELGIHGSMESQACRHVTSCNFSLHTFTRITHVNAPRCTLRGARYMLMEWMA